MTRVAFVTNRPPMGRGFGPPPGVPAVDRLIYGSILVEPSADPVKAGRLLEPALVSGTDLFAGAGPDARLVAFLEQTVGSAIEAGGTPIIVVHGYGYSFADAAIRTADLTSNLSAMPGAPALAPIVFTWPSIEGSAPSNYLGDRDRALASAHALARFIIAFEAAWVACQRPRVLFLAHSMGAWVSQNGLQTLAASGHLLARSMFDQSVIMAGDVDTDAVEHGKGLDELARISNWLSIGVNRTDFAIDVTATRTLHRPRLGTAGPIDPTRLPGNVRVVDYTLAVASDRLPIPPGETSWGYICHQYYRTVAAVRADLAAVLSGQEPHLIAGRRTSQELIDEGEPYIAAGRLYACGVSATPLSIGERMTLAGAG